MATYRRQLKDENGNNIVPVMSGDQTEWIQTGDIADEAVTADKIDFTTSWPLGERIFSLSDGGNSSYSDGSGTSTGWYGYNFSNSGSPYGEAETYSGTYTLNGIGGGLKLKSTLPPGMYFVTVDFEGSEGAADGYRPFRVLCNSTAITGDVAIPYRGGGNSTSRIIHLDPGDTITVQIYRWGSNRVINSRWWLVGFLIRPD